MKKILSILIALTISYFASAQTNTFPSTGNVGIGTDNPQSKLHIHQDTPDLQGLIIQGNTINTDAAQHYIALTLDGDYGNASGNYSQIRSYSNLYSNWGSQLSFYTTSNSATNSLVERMRINASGNVGIGTDNPQNKLHIHQGTPDLPGLIIQGNTINTDGAQHYIALTLDGDYGNATGNYSQIRSYSNLYNNWGSQLSFYTTSNSATNLLVEQMRISANGNVGIGTKTPDAKLTVAGTIHTQEVKVDMTGWSDFVFKKDYNLQPLKEVKTYIDQNHHLPDMPSEQEVIKDGVNLGEMVKLQTRKIEELTLYLIEKDQQLAEQKKNNEKQDARIAALEKALIK